MKLRFSALNLHVSELNLYVRNAYCEESQDYLIFPSHLW